MRLKDIFAQMDAVATELRICKLGGERLRRDINRDHSIAQSLNLGRSEIGRTIERLDHTFIVRLFAVFEWALRELWENLLRRTSEPPIRDLIDAIVAAVGIMPPNFRERVHRIRVFRNSIVHVNAVSELVFTFFEAHAHLKAFLSLMPREW